MTVVYHWAKAAHWAASFWEHKLLHFLFLHLVCLDFLPFAVVYWLCECCARSPTCPVIQSLLQQLHTLANAQSLHGDFLCNHSEGRLPHAIFHIPGAFQNGWQCLATGGDVWYNHLPHLWVGVWGHEENVGCNRSNTITFYCRHNCCVLNKLLLYMMSILWRSTSMCWAIHYTWAFCEEVPVCAEQYTIHDEHSVNKSRCVLSNTPYMSILYINADVHWILHMHIQ